MKYAVDGNTLTAIADAIRMKTETEEKMTTAQMPGKILEIEPGDAPISLQDKYVTPSEEAQTVYPDIDQGYVGLSNVSVGAISKTYVGSGVTKKAAATYTPGTSDQTIASGQYLSGTQTIKGDANLKAANIKSGVSIFGVAGTMSAGVTVQRKESTFTTDSYGGATVNCGFQPDVVLFTGFHMQVEGNDYECHPAVVFPEKQGNYSLFTTGMSSYSSYSVIFDITRTSNGFNVIISDIRETGQNFISNVTFSYVAIKYT